LTANTFAAGQTGSTTISSTGALATPSLTVSGLTSGRVPFASTGGLLQDSSKLTFDSTNGTLSVLSSGAQPTLYNSSNGVGVILRGIATSVTGQLRIIANGGAWTDSQTTTYFQITNSTNENATFMGGSYGSDTQLNRLQFNASSTQFTDYAYTATPIPGALLGAINSTASKVVAVFRGASSQSADIFQAQSSTGSVLVNITSSGNVGVGTTTPAALFSVGGNVIIGASSAGGTNGTLTVSGTGYFGTASTTALKVSGATTLQSLTPSRLLSLDGSGIVSAVSSLTSWIAGTANQITVADDGDGSITLSLPSALSFTAATSTNFFADRLTANTFAAGQTGSTTISS
ncbi:MAG: hypothetical protein AAB737_02595, partial [Patescibacteria group bacterium]